MKIAIPIVAVVVLLIICCIVIYNKLIKADASCEESFSTMDVYLEQRHDLIPNLVNTVKGYLKHEESVLKEVTEARSCINQASSTEDKLNGENKLTNAIAHLFAVAESYPELKADTTFINLQNQLSKVETDIVQARKYYNATVKQYNILIKVFPSNIIANICQFKTRQMFEVENTEHRKNVTIEF